MGFFHISMTLFPIEIDIVGGGTWETCQDALLNFMGIKETNHYFPLHQQPQITGPNTATHTSQLPSPLSLVHSYTILGNSGAILILLNFFDVYGHDMIVAKERSSMCYYTDISNFLSKVTDDDTSYRSEGVVTCYIYYTWP